MQHSSHTERILWPPVALAATFFVSCFFVLPLARFAGLLPLSLLPAGRWLYVAGALSVSVAIASLLQPRIKRLLVALVLSAALFMCVVPVGGALWLFDFLLGDLSVTETITETPSPDGRLVLVHQYLDTGAMGGNDIVYVSGRLVPGVIQWRYDPYYSGETVSDVSWQGNETISIDGQRFTVPVPMRHLAW